MTTEREAFLAWANRTVPMTQQEHNFSLAAWQAACQYQREKDAAICAEFSQDSYARYRASKSGYDDGQCDAANAMYEEIRSAE